LALAVVGFVSSNPAKSGTGWIAPNPAPVGFTKPEAGTALKLAVMPFL